MGSSQHQRQQTLNEVACSVARCRLRAYTLQDEVLKLDSR